MARPPRTPSLDARKPFSLKLDPELAVDLHAFCEAHYQAPHNVVICRALRRFIDSELEADSLARERFHEARQKLCPQETAKPRVGDFRLVSGGSGEGA